MSIALNADIEIIQRILDERPQPAHHLRQFRAIMAHAGQCQLGGGSIFRNWEQLTDYLKIEMAQLRIEQMRALFLDAGQSLIADEVLANGTINEVQCYPRQVARRAVVVNAAGVLLVHNHPSGNPKMSGADKAMTYAVDEACRTVGVRLHDHLVVSRGGFSSFRHDNPLWARSA